MLNRIPSPLLKSIDDGNTSLILGAGASVEAGYPSTRGLTKKLIEKANEYKDLLEGRGLDRVAQLLYNKEGYGVSWVNDNIRSILTGARQEINGLPSEAHKVTTDHKWRTIYTTNYDLLIELSYSRSSSKVQRLIPITAPDPQIDERTDDEVKLIKLNGCIRELKKDVGHKLVITAAEQQKAYRDNADFYDLLRREAATGSIISIGYLTQYPGTDRGGTSPEFKNLRNIIREMGDRAKSHFCVVPTDSIDDVLIQEIKSYNVNIINMTFGEFMSDVNDKTGIKSVPVSKKRSIQVPVSDETYSISHDQYIKDKKHFDILHEDMKIRDAPSISETLNGSQIWASFIQEQAITRDNKNDVKSSILNPRDGYPNIVLLSSPPGWGKTFLLKDIAQELFSEKRPVIWLKNHASIETKSQGSNPVKIHQWDIDRIDNIIKDILDLSHKKEIPNSAAAPIIFADNCVERASEVLSLYRVLKQNGRRFSLVFSARNRDVESLLDSFPLLRDGSHFDIPDDEEATEGEIEALIDTCLKNGVGSIESPDEKGKIKRNILASDADKSIILALYVIFDKQHRPFNEIIEEIWNNLPDDADDGAQKMVLRVASLHHISSAFTPRLYTVLESLSEGNFIRVQSTYDKCERINVLVEEQVENTLCVRLRHSIVADELINTSGVSKDELFDELIELVSHMSNNNIDLSITRNISKRINKYELFIPSLSAAKGFFTAAAEATGNDWVICQQFANFLRRHNSYKDALKWAKLAKEGNPGHPPLDHTIGNILRLYARDLYSNGQHAKAERKLQRARKMFANSRYRGDRDEYGYVTHLSMLIDRIKDTDNQTVKDDLIAEGKHLYDEGLRTIPEDEYNRILQPRFKEYFQLDSEQEARLMSNISESINRGECSTRAAMFLVDTYYKDEEYELALEAIDKFLSNVSSEPIMWAKRAELNARAGDFETASENIHTARANYNNSQDVDVRWKLLYWDLIISVARKDFSRARSVSKKLHVSDIHRGRTPRGYFWLEKARGIDPHERNFTDHAKIWSGRVKAIKDSGQYGQVELSNEVGNTYYVRFNPHYFPMNLRKHDRMEFVITILPTELRADSPHSDPFVDTVDNVYLPD